MKKFNSNFFSFKKLTIRSIFLGLVLMNFNINAQAPCTSGEVIQEYAIDGVWLSGASSITVSPGADLILSGLPNGQNITVWSPSEQFGGDDYTIYGVTASDAGTYRISNGVCSAYLTVIVSGGSGADTQSPSSPTLSSGTISETSVGLSWSGATDNVGVVGYKVYRNTNLQATLGNVSSYVNTGLTASTSYNFTVRAFDAVGNDSPFSNAISVTTNASSGGGGTSTGDSYWTQSGSNIYHNTGNVGIGTTSPQTLLNINVGNGGANGKSGIRVGGTENYASLELGIDGSHDGMIRSYGNNLKYYAGHWKIIGNSATENHNHTWYTSKAGSNDWSTVKMILNENGNLGIGTTDPGTWKLAVNGNIRAKEIKVETGWADYVFEKDYKLPTLEEVEAHIKEEGHLINIPSAKEVAENGIQLGEMNKLLLEKIEELTLYIIEQNKKHELLEKEIDKLKIKESITTDK